jgi:SAM-dependent methyltransferase
VETDRPNAEQVRYWNDAGLQRWVQQQPMLDAMLGPLGRLGIERSGVGAGEHVLDVGCGCGDTTLALGRAVGGNGRVVGIDVSAPMLARARVRAAEAGLAQVEFIEADAQTHRFAADADLVFSRFGVMFFADPLTAFVNLRSALRPGGRLAFVCWQALVKNAWMAVPLAAVAGVIPLPPPLAPGAPGPFAFADSDRVRRILVDAGFIHVTVDPATDTLTLGGEAGLDGAVDLLLETGPVAAALRESGSTERDRVAAAVRDALAPHATPSGIRLAASVWLVTARVS